MLNVCIAISTNLNLWLGDSYHKVEKDNMLRWISGRSQAFTQMSSILIWKGLSNQWTTAKLKNFQKDAAFFWMVPFQSFQIIPMRKNSLILTKKHPKLWGQPVCIHSPEFVRVRWAQWWEFFFKPKTGWSSKSTLGLLFEKICQGNFMNQSPLKKFLVRSWTSWNNLNFNRDSGPKENTLG